MRKQLLIAALAATCVLCYTACKKDSKTTVPATNSTLNNAGDFVKKYGPKTQTFILNTGSLPQAITLTGGTKITIPAGITLNGQIVTGNITVSVIEVLKRSDVILGGTNTNTGSGDLLTSKGFVYIDIKSNGISVDDPLPSPMTIVMPGTNGDNTFLWQGDTNVNGTQQMGWNILQGRTVKATQQGFEFDFGNLGWINCDVFYAIDSPKTTMHVSLPDNPGELANYLGGSGNTFVFLCVQGSLVAAQLYTPDGNGVKSYDNTIPVGVNAQLLAFCIKDGHYYLAEKEITTVNNDTEVLNFTETTDDAIQQAIDALNYY
ncbi:MAG: hypothetical protein BGO69_19640 [Bacteroidetes bacterium 46-16]|nr:MAG: hypothetical protein BGO69_19640 [Bacteroidetes bacterium 46-16]